MQDTLQKFCKKIDAMQGNSDTFNILLQTQNYTYSDPESCLVKTRQIIELFVDGIYKTYKIDIFDYDKMGGGII